MITLTQKEQSHLENLGIKAVILFGSVAQGLQNKASDYDFFVIGKKSDEVYEELYNLLSKKINKIIDIDIVFDQDAPMELKNHVSKYGQVLYAKSNNTFPDFKQKTMIEYSDFAPLRAIFSNATIARIDSR